MLHAVTGARSVGSELRQTNQTSRESIGLTSPNVASMFISIFKCDHGNAIWLAKTGRSSMREKGDYCARSFLSVISVTYPLLER
ncbi:MAG TPA: hypothetical protein DC012_04865 [Escherichia sp.]|nr:hypothetical protein [Escherichia sp.]